MSKYVITTDSTVDLGLERVNELGVPYVCMRYVKKGVEHLDDMRDETANAIFEAMRGGESFSTVQTSCDELTELWRPILMDGADVIHLAFSSGLSGSHNSARLAAEILKDEYPERKIYVIDSLCASGGQGLLLEHMMMKRGEGASVDECIDWTEKNKLRIEHWFTVSELSYLRRGGRISAAKAFVADMLHIKPVLDMDRDGKLAQREIVKGRRGSIKKMFEHMCESISLHENPFVRIAHADCISDAKYLAELIKGRFNGVIVRISSIGSAIGAHSGPGTLALFFISKCARI